MARTSDMQSDLIGLGEALIYTHKHTQTSCKPLPSHFSPPLFLKSQLSLSSSLGLKLSLLNRTTTIQPAAVLPILDASLTDWASSPTSVSNDNNSHSPYKLYSYADIPLKCQRAVITVSSPIPALFSLPHHHTSLLLLCFTLPPLGLSPVKFKRYPHVHLLFCFCCMCASLLL